MSDGFQRRTLVSGERPFGVAFLKLTGPEGPVNFKQEVLRMWDRYLKVGVTLLLDILHDDNESSRHKKMLLKLFRAIAEAFNTDAEFRNAANEAFKK